MAALSGCGAAVPEQAADDGPVGTAEQRIMGGTADAADHAVVDVIRISSGSGYSACSGSLIAPNVVLTAHHCVADVQNASAGVDCTSTSFGAPDAPGHLWVSTQENLPMPPSPPAGFHAVQEIVVPPSSTNNGFCGLDQAIIILAGTVPTSEAAPLTPRIDSEIAAGDVYAAVGFGLTSDTATDSGTRRRLGGQAVACVGQSCSSFKGNIDTQHEWGGAAGPCEGDSGGPALDAQNRVIGVTSRALVGCKSPIYGDVFSWADWIAQTAQHAATVGGYTAPPWAQDPPMSSTSSGCSFGTATPHGPAPWLLYAALGALALLRRRR
jgi:MYXO-CTERM domain-containing protein